MGAGSSRAQRSYQPVPENQNNRPNQRPPNNQPLNNQQPVEVNAVNNRGFPPFRGPYIERFYGQELTEVPEVPEQTTVLDITRNQIRQLENLPPRLEHLRVDENPIVSLENLPNTLLTIHAHQCPQLARIESLPDSLTELELWRTSIEILPPLPPNLRILRITGSRLRSLPELPPNLEELEIDGNQIPEVPTLPQSLRTFTCQDNQIRALPPLPPNITLLNIANNQITRIDSLPPALETLQSQGNQLTELPPLPPGLRILYCYSNKLKKLPELPNTIEVLYASNNQLTYPPELPNSLQHVDMGGNPYKEPFATIFTNHWWNLRALRPAIRQARENIKQKGRNLTALRGIRKGNFINPNINAQIAYTLSGIKNKSLQNQIAWLRRRINDPTENEPELTNAEKRARWLALIGEETNNSSRGGRLQTRKYKRQLRRSKTRAHTRK